MCRTGSCLGEGRDVGLGLALGLALGLRLRVLGLRLESGRVVTVGDAIRVEHGDELKDETLAQPGEG